MADNSNSAPEPRAVSDAYAGRSPAPRESFNSDAEAQQYQNRFIWEKSQTDKK